MQNNHDDSKKKEAAAANNSATNPPTTSASSGFGLADAGGLSFIDYVWFILEKYTSKIEVYL